MAPPDMGWARKADAPAGTLTASVGWDSKTGLVVVRARTFWGTYNPVTDKWTKWADAAGGSDSEASVTMDLDGRKMYVLGNRLGGVVDLDTHVVTALGMAARRRAPRGSKTFSPLGTTVVSGTDRE